MFSQPMGIALEANGNPLVADSWNMRLREVTPSGLTRTWAGNGQNAVVNGPGSSASLTYPMAVAVLPGGDALIVEPDIGIIRRVSASSTHDVSQYAGPELFSNGSDGWADGPAGQANVYHTVALAVRPSDGQVLLVDGASARLRAIKGGCIDTLAGGLRGHTVDGSGPQSGFGAPRGVAIAPDGSAYVVDAKDHTLRHVTF